MSYTDDLLPEEGVCFEDAADAKVVINAWMEELLRSSPKRLSLLIDEATMREIKHVGDFREDVMRILDAAAGYVPSTPHVEETEQETKELWVNVGRDAVKLELPTPPSDNIIQLFRR